MLCRQALSAPIDLAPSGRAAARPSTKFRSSAMSDEIARRLSNAVTLSAQSHWKPWLIGLIAGACSTVGRWFARSRQRRSLREVAERNDFHVLKDIGVSQGEALQEA